jgi:hypothetical protein
VYQQEILPCETLLLWQKCQRTLLSAVVVEPNAKLPSSVSILWGVLGDGRVEDLLLLIGLATKSDIHREQAQALIREGARSQLGDEFARPIGREILPHSQDLECTNSRGSRVSGQFPQIFEGHCTVGFSSTLR